MKLNRKLIIVISICLIVVLMLAVFLLIPKEETTNNTLDINKTNYLTVTEKIYSAKNVSVSALHYPLFVLDKDMTLSTLNGKDKLDSFGVMKPYSPSLNEFELQLIDPDLRDEFSAKAFLNNNKRAWRIDCESNNSSYYLLFEQNNGDCFLAIGSLYNSYSTDYIRVIFATEISTQNSDTTIFD